MEPLIESDLKELLREFSEYTKCFMVCAKERKEHLNSIAMLKESLKLAEASEQKIKSKLKEKQENIIQLQNILNGYINTKEENESLKKEMKELQVLLEQERTKRQTDEENWNKERENIINSNREEIENMKKIRNMEVMSLNREISRIQEENHQKVEFLKRDVERAEDDHKRSVVNYEEKITRMSRELVSVQCQLKNLQQTNKDLSFYTVDSTPTKERYIPQPLSFSRYKPLVPIISTASQMYQDVSEKSSENTNEKKEKEAPQIKKKRKLYTRSDDLI